MWVRSRLTRWTVVPGVLALVALVAAAWYLGSPLFIRTRTVEQSPFAAPATQAGPDGASGGDALRGPGVPESASLKTAQIAPGVSILGSGMFTDRDQVHRGRGQAILGQTPDGASFLRFEAFSVTNGPDLHVLLSRAVHPATNDEVYNGVYVGKLKASEGAFHYELPAGTDLSAIKSVVVYCVPFRVIFSSAPLGQG